MRQLLSREVARQFKDVQNGRADTRLVTALSALLSHDVAKASSWKNLADRLRPHGYALRVTKGEVALYKVSCGTHVCSGDEIGIEYDTLCKRFGGTVPAGQAKNSPLGMMPGGKIDRVRHQMLCDHIDMARNWADFINRLAGEGMELRPIGAGVGIFVSSTGRHLCNLGSLGTRYVTLVKRYGAPLPNHTPDLSTPHASRAKE
ncbi:MAG: hypothetical protein ABJJ53_10605 [Sulfitobacter sp.]